MGVGGFVWVGPGTLLTEHVGSEGGGGGALAMMGLVFVNVNVLYPNQEKWAIKKVS